MTGDSNNIITSKVAERLGFFFSNANLRMDRFLRREVLEKVENDGFVQIETLLKFNTVKSITEDVKIIADAVKEVKNPPLKLNDDNTAIARVDPFTQDMMNDNVKVTLRISNIPLKDEDKCPEYDVSRDEMVELFKEFGDVAMVRLLKSKMNGFDERVAVGRAFVEFHTVEGMEKAKAALCTENIKDDTLKPQKTLNVKGTELKVKTMQQWLDKKGQKEGKAPKKRKTGGDDAKKDIEAIEFKLDWKTGCVIQVKGLPDNCDREAILTAVKSFMGDEITVRADYSRGNKDGAIRFDEATGKINELAEAFNEGKTMINESKVESACVLEGDEEKKYYDDYISFRTKQMRANAEEKQKRKKRRGRY